MTANEDIRREMKARRKALDAETAESLSRDIVEKLRLLPEYREAKTVMIYRAVKGEVSLEGLEGKTFAYPLCTGPGEMLSLVPRDEGAWKAGPFGIPEPERERSRILSPDKIDLVICPCTAFDTSCRRLGMGGGYYDRFLPKCKNARFIAVAYEFQRWEDISWQTWDVVMDAVVTEKQVYRPESRP